jgi:tetratricopeptide (TPR) repeat protein
MQKFLFSFRLPSSLSCFYLRNMDCCARLNNVGASQLVTGRYANAIDSFTRSMGLAKSALALLVAENQAKHMNNCTSRSMQQQRRCAVVLFMHSAASVAAAEAKVQTVVDDRQKTLRGLYMFPLYLSESAEYQRYEPTVEASIAIMFNLALAHHLIALYGPFNRYVCTLEQAIDLYELAYTVQMNEDAKLSIEFSMAIINNLGHIHRLLGDEDRGSQCFRHLLSTIFFFRSYGERHVNSDCCHTDTFVYSVSHLILQKAVAAAA